MSTTDDTNETLRIDENTNGPRCGNCDEEVTREYHRVLSDSEGILRSCLHCTPKGDNRGAWL